MFKEDPTLYEQQLAKRRAFSELKFGKVDTHPYDLIKNKKGYDALIKFQQEACSIHIPEYRLVRRFNGVEHVTISNVQSNHDIVKLWRKELDHQKKQLQQPDSERQLIGSSSKMRPESIDQSREQ